MLGHNWVPVKITFYIAFMYFSQRFWALSWFITALRRAMTAHSNTIGKDIPMKYINCKDIEWITLWRKVMESPKYSMKVKLCKILWSYIAQLMSPKECIFPDYDNCTVPKMWSRLLLRLYSGNFLSLETVPKNKRQESIEIQTHISQVIESFPGLWMVLK